MHSNGPRLVAEPVCSKVMSGSAIRRAYLSPAAFRQRCLQGMSTYFVDCLNLLQKSHQNAGIVPRDMRLGNLTVAIARGSRR